MTKTLNKINIATIGIPLLLIGILIWLASLKIFDQNLGLLAKGVTIDLLFTIPIIYLLLIRKKNIPKITIVPVFVLGMIIASNVLPKEHQTLLQWVKTWIFPIVELGVVTFILYKVKQTFALYRDRVQSIPDFFSALKNACEEIFPGKVGTLLAMEIAVFYYGFLYWSKRVISKNEFTYHKNSGTISLLIALIPIIGIETYVLHVLLEKWSTMVAWIVSGISVYSGIQIFGFLKSLMKRPISIDNNQLHLRYGILSETSINLHHIESVEISSKDLEWNTTTRKLSPLGELESHNVIITLKEEQVLYGLYGMKKTFTTLAFFVDHKEQFKSCLEEQLRKDILFDL
ncbi:hypothetical protein SAMN04488508_107333 [Aquimarina spongiae]|uniref:Uncharacterized protein n=2 Tax=Aquimarina spongiae TaxID=570521 RepID=A0A1M6IFV6_9FLAO|nr:hypothetical protein SAMN04488508_107333 [Aquimarina spongiae]